ncbi:MAG TPA: cellulase family glycosylhydrolase [Ignavibacteriaceae bacterium]|nr:cellulase family glycosylhydrolase [Ignavibacteriaceae bacterium]
MYRFNKSLLSITIFIILFSTTLFADGFLRTSGKKIVDANGAEVYLTGYGLGGWLVPEGYMIGTSSFANPAWQFRKKIEELIGVESTNQFFQLYRKNYVQRKDIQKMKEWGFNSVRLPMHYNLFTPKDQPGVWIEEGFAIIDSLLDWCEENQMYIILDLHAAPGGQSDEGISDYNPAEPSLWQSETNKQRTIELWRRIAERYSNKTWIAGYDLLNEPKWDLGANNVPLRELYIAITNSIRQVDTNHILFIEGNWYATDFSGLTPPWDNNMAYSFHKYWSDVNTNSINYLLNIRNTYNVPLWMGESGENSNSWFTDFIELLKNQNIGWAWWPHKKFDSISGAFSAKKNPEYEYLLKYWSGQASKPTAAYAVDALTKMASNLEMDSCIINYGVIDAMTRQPFNEFTVPFKTHNIPGFMYAVHYDYGKNNFAYKDIVHQNTGSGTYNNGWAYRNDGVDIEKCSDLQGMGYNVGWTETGEFLKFTVNVTTSGIYSVHFRIASNQAGGKIMLKADNNTLGVIDVPVTGGWQSWQTITLDSVYISSATRSITTTFFFGGFNFNYLAFDLLTTDIKTDEVSPVEFQLYQNYPNPFNPKTKIRFSISSSETKSNTTLKIYDVLGNEITTLFNDVLNTGLHEIDFDAQNLSSGIYFYELRSGEFVSTKKLILTK